MHSQLLRLLRDNAQARARLPLKAEAIKAEDGSEEATLYIYDIIVSDDWWGGVKAEDFVREIMSITAPVIHIRINSPGGDVFAGRAMEQAIREHPSKCIAHVDGYAASAASFVAVACDEVEMAAGAFFMIHRAWTFEAGNCEDFTKTAAFLAKVDGTMAGTYARETGQPEEECLRMMSEETWLTAQEAVDLGFADRIAENQAKAQAADLSGWNLSAYAKAPHAAGQPAHAPQDAFLAGRQQPQDDDTTTNHDRERYDRLAALHGTPRPASRAA